MLKQPVRTSLSDLIKSTMGSQFVIPVYQRNYTWNPEKETARLMDDIEDLLAGNTVNHFLGIIIYLESQVSAMFRQLQIVDGQQRLTTSFIFLLALKQIARDRKEKETVGMIDDYYLYNRHVIAEAQMRLKPAVSDDDVFAKLVYGSVRDLNRKDKETSVYRNYDYIYRRLQKLNQKYSILEILDTFRRIDVLEFPLSETDNAQQIFESINSTGAPLTSADLIRNYILMNDTDETQERYYRMYWKSLEGYFPESRKLEEFFRYYLAAKTCNLYSRRDVYEGFKEFWVKEKEGKEAKLQEINRYCIYYDTIYNGPEEDPEIEKVLKDFRVSGSRLPAPFLIEMYAMYASGKITRDELVHVVRLIDSYIIRRALVGNDNNALSSYFPNLLRSVVRTWKKTRADIYEITKTSLVAYNKGKSLAMPTDDMIRSQLKEVNAYSLMCIRPVLDRIEHYGSTADVDTSQLNIEHIMPQHPNAYWKKNSGAGNEDDYTFYVNLIGNLTLCSEYDNSRIGNEDFAFKKKILSKTQHIRLNTNILKKKSWTVKDILKRCEEIAEQIIRIYPYETETVKVEKINDDIIVLSAPTVSARAIYHNPQSIEILPGTTMKAYHNREMKKNRQLYDDMYARDILSEDENGLIHFEQSFIFSGLNEAAQFLMHRGGENAQAWSYEDGSKIAEAAPAKEPEKKEPESKEPEKKEAPAQTKKKKSGRKAEAAKKPAGKKEPAKKKTAKKKTARKAEPAEEKAEEKPVTIKREVRRYTKKKKEEAPQEPVTEAPAESSAPEEN